MRLQRLLFLTNPTLDSKIINRIDATSAADASRVRSAGLTSFGSMPHHIPKTVFLLSISDQSVHPQTKLGLAITPQEQDQALSLLAYSLSTALFRGDDFLAFLKKQYSENNSFQLSLAHNCKSALVDYYETHELDIGEDQVLEIDHIDLNFNLKRVLDSIISKKDFLYAYHNNKLLSSVKVRIVDRERLGPWRSQEEVSHGALLFGLIPLDDSKPLTLKNKNSHELFSSQRLEAITFFNRNYEYQTSSNASLYLEIEYNVGLALEIEEQRSPSSEMCSVIPPYAARVVV